MSRFAVIDLPQVHGKVRFSKLEIDGVCPFDQFSEAVEREGNLRKQLRTIYDRMQQVADMKLLPKEKFRNITPSGESVKEFEIKTNDLRVYLIKEEGHITIIGGKKNSQAADMKKFRSVKRRYLQSKSKM